MQAQHEPRNLGGSDNPGLIDSDTQCIEKLTFNPASIDACWGDRSVRFSRLGLILSYLITTGGFGALVGLIMIGPAARQPPKSR